MQPRHSGASLTEAKETALALSQKTEAIPRLALFLSRLTESPFSLADAVYILPLYCLPYSPHSRGGLPRGPHGAAAIPALLSRLPLVVDAVLSPKLFAECIRFWLPYRILLEFPWYILLVALRDLLLFCILWRQRILIKK